MITVAVQVGAKMIHYSKIDYLSTAVLGLSAVVLFLLGGHYFVGENRLTLSSIIASGIVVLVSVSFIYPMYYQIGASVLTIRSGFTRTRIPISQILTIKPSWNPLSSTALSVDSLRIDYLATFVVISPKDKNKFIHDLARQDPGLIVRDDGLACARRGLETELAHQSNWWHKLWSGSR